MEELLSTGTSKPRTKKPSKAVVDQSPSPVLVEEDIAEPQISPAPVGAAATPAALQRVTSSSSTSSPVMVSAPDVGEDEEEVIVTSPTSSKEAVDEEDAPADVADPAVDEEDVPAVEEEDAPAADEEPVPVVEEAVDDEASPAADEEGTPADEERVPVVEEDDAPAASIEEVAPVVAEEAAPVVVEEATPAVADEAAPVVEEDAPTAIKEEASKETPAELEEEGTPTFSVAGAATVEPSRGPLFVVETHHETEEVLERLLDVKGVTESVSGLWGWMQGSATKVVEAANQAKEQATIKANEVKEQAAAAALVAKEQASAAANVAKEHATVAAAQIQEQTAIKAQQIKEQASLAATAVSKGLETATTANKGEGSASPPQVVALLPWDTILPERRAEAKERILKLSMDDQTFTVPPPKEAAYEFDAVQREAMAHRMLDADALLGAKRFKLVPKTVQETEFWRNYFYRVDLIASAIGSKIDGEEASPAVSMSATAAQTATASSLLDFDEEMRKDLEAVVAHGDSSENFDMLEDDDLEFDDDDELDLAKELE